jgi:hypothetical protein
VTVEAGVMLLLPVSRFSFFVVTGLDPDDPELSWCASQQEVDGRIKPGRDDPRCRPPAPVLPVTGVRWR